jgi:hypothetical protein
MAVTMSAACVGERGDLGGVVVARLRGGQLRARVVGIVLRTDAAADHDGRAACVLVAHVFHQLDRPSVRLVERPGVVADLRRPAGAGPPRGTFEHEAEPALSRQVGERVVVALQPGGPGLVLEQVERREGRQVDPS